MSLIKVYHLVFYKVRSFLKWTNEDGWEDWRALAMFLLLQIVLLLQLCVWFTVIFKKILFDIPNIKLALALFSFLLSYLNYYALLHNDKWKKYAIEFEAYSPKKRMITGWAVFLFFIASIAGLVFAFYQMSLIDWSKYR